MTHAIYILYLPFVESILKLIKFEIFVNVLKLHYVDINLPNKKKSKKSQFILQWINNTTEIDGFRNW